MDIRIDGDYHIHYERTNAENWSQFRYHGQKVRDYHINVSSNLTFEEEKDKLYLAKPGFASNVFSQDMRLCSIEFILKKEVEQEYNYTLLEIAFPNYAVQAATQPKPEIIASNTKTQANLYFFRKVIYSLDFFEAIIQFNPNYITTFSTTSTSIVFPEMKGLSITEVSNLNESSVKLILSMSPRRLLIIFNFPSFMETLSG